MFQVLVIEDQDKLRRNLQIHSDLRQSGYAEPVDDRAWDRTPRTPLPARGINIGALKVLLSDRVNLAVGRSKERQS